MKVVTVLFFIINLIVDEKENEIWIEKEVGKVGAVDRAVKVEIEVKKGV